MLGSAANAKDLAQDLSDLDYLRDTSILQAMIAKELCTCHFVAHLSIDTCEKNVELPDALFMAVTIMDDPVKKTITVYPNFEFSPEPAMAAFNKEFPQRGCRLVYGALEQEPKPQPEHETEPRTRAIQ